MDCTRNVGPCVGTATAGGQLPSWNGWHMLSQSSAATMQHVVHRPSSVTVSLPRSLPSPQVYASTGSSMPKHVGSLEVPQGASLFAADSLSSPSPRIPRDTSPRSIASPRVMSPRTVSPRRIASPPAPTPRSLPAQYIISPQAVQAFPGCGHSVVTRRDGPTAKKADTPCAPPTTVKMLEQLSRSVQTLEAQTQQLQADKRCLEQRVGSLEVHNQSLKNAVNTDAAKGKSLQAKLAEHDHEHVDKRRKMPQPHRPMQSKTPPAGNCKKSKTRYSNAHTKKMTIAEGVELTRTENDQNDETYLEIMNRKLATLEFSAGFGADAKNISWKGLPGGEPEVKIEVPAMTRLKIGTICVNDVHDESNLDLSFSWTHKPIDRESMNEILAQEHKELKVAADLVREHGITASKMGSAADIQDACTRAGLKHFVDLEFLPNDCALFKNPEDPEHHPLIWKRPADFMEGSICLFTDEVVSPEDIRQGALGDCWFLAALAAMAEHPSLIKDVFRHTSYNEIGVYELTCTKNGKETRIILDDYFPCDPCSGQPCYSRTHGNELWVLLLEKAWAKLHGSYEHLEGGVPCNAIMDLCGGPGISLYFEDAHVQRIIKDGMFLSMLTDWVGHGYLMVAGTPGTDTFSKDGSADGLPSTGLIPGHAYTVRNIKKRANKRLVNLRNPWGKFEWNGDWSDDSPLWTTEMKTYFKPLLHGDDGIFWMSEEDFLKYFTEVHLVFHRGHITEKWAIGQLPMVSTDSDMCDKVLEFEVSLSAHGFMTIHQNDMHVEGTPPYKSFSFAVYGLDSSGLPSKEILRSEIDACRDNVVQIDLGKPISPGRYVAAAFSPDRVEGVAVVITAHLSLGNNWVPNLIPYQTREFTPEMRHAMALATATSSEHAVLKSLGGLLQTAGAFLPGGNYAFAACNTHDEDFDLAFDFSSCGGLELIDPGKGKMVTRSIPLEAQGKMQLIAELRRVGEDAMFNVQFCDEACI